MNRVITTESRILSSTAVFLTSICITLLFWASLPAQFQSNESSDYRFFYEPVARNILTGNGYVTTDGTFATAYPPGYPLLLASTFGLATLLNLPETLTLSALMLVSVGLSTAFIYLVTQMVWDRIAAAIAAILWATYPFALWLTKQPNSEIPFTAIFYGAVCLLWYLISGTRKHWALYFILGVLVGVAMLVRPIAIGVGLIMAGVVWVFRSKEPYRYRLFCVALLFLGNLVVVLPWQLTLYRQTGEIVPLSTNGPASMLDGMTFAINTKGYRQTGEVPTAVAALMQEMLAQQDSFHSVRDIVTYLVAELQTRPGAVAQLLLIKALRSWYGTDSSRLETPILAIQMFYLSIAGYGTLSAWQQGNSSRKFVVIAWLLVLYFWGMTILALPILRYMVPAMGLLLALAAAGSFSLRQRFFSHKPFYKS